MKHIFSNEDNTCTTEFVSGDGTLSFYAGCDPDTQECYNSNEYCTDCLDVPDWNNRSDDTCGETQIEYAYFDDV